MTFLGFRPSEPNYKLVMCNLCGNGFFSYFRRGLCDECFGGFVKANAEREALEKSDDTTWRDMWAEIQADQATA